MAVKFAPQDLSLLSHSYLLPNESISNESLYHMLQTQCGFFHARKAKIIAHKMGIQQRHWVRDLSKSRSQPSPTAIDLGAQVLRKALQGANLEAAQLDYLISHTCTPHTQVPPNAAWLADKLNFAGPYLELRQACTGFANGLQVASAFAAAGSDYLAITGIETGSVYCEMSKEFLNSEQLVNLMQMGDGAAAVVLAPANGGRQRLSDIYLGQVGQGKQPGFYLDGGSHNIGFGNMARFSHDTEAVRAQGSQLFELGLKAVLERGYHLDDFKYILPHQANGHIDKLLADALDIEPNRIINHAKNMGNLGSAAIWVSFSQMLASYPLAEGDKVLVLGAEATKYLYGGFVYTH
ncbi:3-oxoacyl-ACP synthase III family protein [Shewanella gelidii]|uniref:3-oxoacyl-[acyl-carrier-protein] synthase 3 n=1 Tax=Shewanella gelidii TaxID=1642821 RepID=A0A917JLV8_9GAMM|nr:3-oxoacyl-[acyl-carrier-protein] synthase III C-terminal domain-containing protein [Shewanella gelidii]MCL1096827.1 3-oxoacyl-ACP synthase [Shewanella gelidii]GGI70446.1 3-oxoacyl-[acyl-carrier-protein] synthase 3 [Shewanella gelidii]